MRRRVHTGSEAEEKLLGNSKVISSGAFSTYNIFSTAEFPHPSIVLSDGKTTTLDEPAYELYRASESREDRQKAMAGFFGALASYRGTFGSVMNTNVQASIFYARAHKYGSSLEASLADANIPASVYPRLLEGVKPQPAYVSSVLDASQTYAGPGRDALLRFVCTAGEIG